MSTGLPKLLSAQATLLAGQIVTLDTTALRNPFRSGLWCYGIRHHITSNAASGANRAAFIEVQFNMGRHFFSERPIPVPLLDRMWNNDVDNGENCSTMNSGGTATASIGNHFTWKFPKPLYIPEGEVLVAKYYNPATATTGVITSYVCQSADGPAPLEINLPFLSVWTAGGGIGGATKFTDASNENDLVNPYPEHAVVKRINGRISRSYLNDAQNFATSVSIPGLKVKAWATSSSGQAIVRDPAFWSHLFQMQFRSWLTNSVLSPGESYIFNVEQDYSAFGSLSTITFRPQIVLMGHRKVRL